MEGSWACIAAYELPPISADPAQVIVPVLISLWQLHFWGGNSRSGRVTRFCTGRLAVVQQLLEAHAILEKEAVAWAMDAAAGMALKLAKGLEDIAAAGESTEASVILTRLSQKKNNKLDLRDT